VTKLSLSRAWDETRAVLARDGRLFVAVAAALLLLPQTFVGVIAPPPNLSGQEPPGWLPALSLVVAFASLIGQLAIARLAIGPVASVGEAISHGSRRVLPLFAALILFGAVLVIILIPLALVLLGGDRIEALAEGSRDPAIVRALFPLVLVVIAIAARFQLMVPVASAEAGGPVKILRQSWNLSKGNYWRFLGFLLLALTMTLIILLVSQMIGGILARLLFGDLHPFTIGALILALFTAAAQAALSVFVTVMLARFYVQLSGPAHDAVSVPSSGT
jgi:hypothetical protein